MSPLRKRLSLLVIAALIIPLLTGCYDRIELEGMAFVVAMGIDKGPDQTVDVTARIAIPSAMPGGDGGGGGNAGGGGSTQNSQGSKPITVRAKTLAEALTLLNATVERRVSLLHLTSILISDSISRDGMINYLRPLVRNREVRRTLTITFTKGEAREVFLSNDPVVERSSTRWQEAIYEVGRYSWLNATKKLHEFVVSLETPFEDPYGPVMTVNKAVKKQKENSQNGSGDGGDGLEERMPSYKPGQLARLGGNNLDMIGAAIFRNDKLVTYLDGLDTRLLLMVRGEIARTQMDFDDPLAKGKLVGVELKHARSPEITVDFSKKPVQVRVRQKLEGDLIGVQGDADYILPKNMNQVEQSISKELKERQTKLISRLFHQYQAEPFGIFKKARTQFATGQEMNDIKFRELLKDAEVTTDVDLQLRRFGVQMAPVVGK
ncbi:hypothetical protein CBW65_16330 [Tumebacillus avium]|uniref:Uncharacterized protein n=1 Tax=Tumebacillus avium TaxID=1903704 RepID=A0A1Y0ISN2_9BACL|nr:Ger(x)C family spore germination protein [Tumebacillus avium]ARU62354.1 hypothetical protein CBW65_16330 [Tumebacillus avium]